MTDPNLTLDPLFPDRPWTVCFYSFRGGVGQTTLAISIALSLRPAKTGVFLLDFDLEAPGIDEFKKLVPPNAEQPGLVEYIADYQRTGRSAELRGFVYPYGDRPSGREAPDPQVYLMRAGRRGATHRRFLAQFDWEWFYRFEDGYLFFENLRAGVRKELDCGYMLIDSRSGLTEVGSVCLGHLADAVVLVFQPTTAHLQGLIDVVQEIRKREEREGRLIPRLYVASKVHELHEGELDPESVSVAEGIVQRCEGIAEFDCPPGRWEFEQDLARDWPNATVPTLHYISNRMRVKGQHVPDAYLVEVCHAAPSLTELEWEYVAVEEWIKGTRAALEAEDPALQQRVLELRRAAERQLEVRRALQREVVEMLAQLPPTEIERRLQEQPAALETLREVLQGPSAELLAPLSPEQQVVLRKLLAQKPAEAGE